MQIQQLLEWGSLHLLQSLEVFLYFMLFHTRVSSSETLTFKCPLRYYDGLVFIVLLLFHT